MAKKRLKLKIYDMADIIIRGFIDKIHFLRNQNGGIMQVSEFKKGFKKNGGEIVPDRYISWNVIFRHGQSSYLNTHFNTGMLVKVKGEVLPYAMKQHQFVDGYTVLMDSCAVDSYPRSSAKAEVRMMKESQMNNEDSPDLEAFERPDF